MHEHPLTSEALRCSYVAIERDDMSAALWKATELLKEDRLEAIRSLQKMGDISLRSAYDLVLKIIDSSA